MPWNNGGPGPWGKPSGSSGGDGDKKPTPGPWGNPGGNKNGNGDGGGERPDPDRGPRRPGGPFGGGGGPFGGGPFGGGNQPDLDRLIAQAQAYIRSLLGGGSGRGPSGGRFGGFANSRGLVLLLLAVVVLWVGSGFYRVQPDEQGVVLQFGAYSYWTPPGLHWHVPWPIEEVELPTVTRINRTEIGYRSAAGGNVESGQDSTGRDVLAESLMLTGDENIIDIDVAVFWRISDAPAFLFNTANPETLVRGVAESSMREVIGRTPIQPALGPLRGQIEADVLKQTQEILDRYKAGVEITQVQLQKVDPPAAVIESFRDVQRANTDAERMRNEAESYRNDIVPRARGDAARIVAEGQGAKAASVAQANGQAQRFDSVLKAYQAAKDVTLRRMYLDTMEDVLAHAQPLVVDDKLRGLVPFLPLNVPPTGPGGTTRAGFVRVRWSQPMNRATIAGLALVVVLAIVASASLFTVTQTEQVLVVQFGKVVRPIEDPGLHAKWPIAQNIISFDKRLLAVELPGEEVILGDQRRLIIDTFTVFRITDPLRFYQAIGPIADNIRGRLNSVVTGSLRRVLGNNKLLDVLSADRERIMSTIRGQVNTEMQNFGVTIVDVRIRRADLPQENTQAILSRMQSERQRVAAQARAEGAEASQRIKADAERERTVLVADAKATADNLRGEGEGEATNIYAKAFGQDPAFFSIWRTLQGYHDIFDSGVARLVVSPDNDYLKYLQAPPPEPSR